MRVVVGSKNPAKLAAVKRAFAQYFPDETITCEGVEADSGVSEQPLSIPETISGAIKRAEQSARPDADYSVDIEGGMSFYDIGGREYGIEIGFACVCDCRTKVREIASSPGYSVFPGVIDRIKAGQTLGEAMAAAYHLENLGQKNGYIGWLSDDRLTRESSNAEAVLLALSSLCKEEKT